MPKESYLKAEVNFVHSSHMLDASQIERVRRLRNWGINGGMAVMRCGGTVSGKQRILRDGYASQDLSFSQQHCRRLKSFAMWHHPTFTLLDPEDAGTKSLNMAGTTHQPHTVSHFRRL